MPANARRQLNGKFLVILAVLGLALLCNSADAQRLRIIPVPPHVVPQWTPMPDLPQVAYAPNVPTDVFKHRGRYYLYWAGAWYRSKNIKGPWMLAPRPPAVLSQINQEYFKTASRPGAQPPASATPGPSSEGGFVTPEGKPAVPPPSPPVSPQAPVPPSPPAGASVPPPPQPVPQEGAAPGQEKMAPPVEGAQPAQPDAYKEEPEDEETPPPAIPKGEMPKAM